MVGSQAILLAAALAPVPSHAPPAWQWPLRPPPRVVRGFSPPAHPWEAGHRGVDLVARPGRPVYAAGPGRVGFAGDLAGRGVVTIVHGALRTTYLPVRPAVRAGQTVHAGDRIGVVAGAPGHCADQTCLHWGLLRGVTYLDPLRLLGLGPVRLLPWWPETPGTTGSIPPAPRHGDRPAAPPYGDPPVAPHGDPHAASPYGGSPIRADEARELGLDPPRRPGGHGPARSDAGRATSTRRVSPSRSLAARLASAAAPGGADVTAGAAALGALSALLTSTLAARLRHRPPHRSSRRVPGRRT